MTFTEALAIARGLRPIVSLLATQLKLARQDGSFTQAQREQIVAEAGLSDAMVDAAVDAARSRQGGGG